jgi:hypothetical protein
MARRRWVLGAFGLAAVVAGAAALVVVAATRGADEPTRAEYLARAEAICKDYGERLDRIPPPGDLSSPGSIVESLEQALPLLREQEDAVRALVAPAALRARLDRFYALTDRSLDELQAALDAALERELYPMATALTRFGDVRNQAKRVAREIGFRC